ncbi:hypothetical protein KCU73_g11264, partial [Aureobasidium melanogenum]
MNTKMGEIYDLRDQILDNIRALNPHFSEDSHFLPSWNVENGSVKWTVILGALGPDKRYKYFVTYGIGTGGTAEDAYKDLLKTTALRLDKRGHTSMTSNVHPINE